MGKNAIREEERNTRKRASVTVSVMCERRCREPLIAWAFRSSSDAGATSGSVVTITVTLASLLVLSFSHSFRGKERLLRQETPQAGNNKLPYETHYLLTVQEGVLCLDDES